MKEILSTHQETGSTQIERLSERSLIIFRTADAEVAVEVYGAADEEDSEEVLSSAAAEVYARHREELQALLEGSSIASEVLAIYDEFSKGSIDTKEVPDLLKKVVQASSEYIEEVGKVAAEAEAIRDERTLHLSAFLDKQVMDNADNRAVRSAWGFAKLDYEQGDATKLRELLTEVVRTTEDMSLKQEAAGYLEFLK